MITYNISTIAGWKQRAEAAEAEVERLKNENERLMQAIQTAVAEILRLSEVINSTED